MKVVEHDQVEAAFERAFVRRDVRLGRHCGGGLRGRRDWQIHHGERGDGLPPVVLQHLEVVAGQVGHEVAVLIRHDRVHFDVVDLDTEVHLGLRRWRGVRLLRVHRGAECQHRRQREGA
jgi:hypothetical protein